MKRGVRRVFRAKFKGREASGNARLCSSSAPVNAFDGSPAAEGHDRGDLNVTQDLTDQDVPLASRSLLFFFTKGKIK